MVEIMIDHISEEIVETIHEPLLVLDSDLKVLLANRCFIDSFKVTREETLGSFIYDLGNRQWNIPGLRELLEKILPENKLFNNYEVEHNFATIGKRIMLLNARQIEQAVGKEQIILLAIEDITERKETEFELSRYRQGLEKLVEEQTVDLNERVKEIGCLYAVLSLFSKPFKSIDEVLKATVSVIPNGWQYPEFCRARIVFEGRTFAAEDFRETTWKQSADIVLSGEAVGTVEVCYLEEMPALDEGPFRKEEWNLIGELARQLAGLIQRKHNLVRIEYLNSVLQSLRNINLLIVQEKRRGPLIQMICKNLAQADDIRGAWIVLTDELLDQVLAEFEAQARGDKLLVPNLPCLRKDGSVIYADVQTTSVIIDDRECKVGFFTDVTESKQMEAQFHQAQKMEAIGTLAAGVAHDFNNILTAIIGNANLALMEVDKDGPLREEIREEIEDIKVSGERAASLIRQLLAFSRKQVVRPELLDLNALLTGIEKMIVRLIGENVELLTITMPELWQVEMDPGQMEQVIMNLAVNAKDSMPKGGKLTIEVANMELDKNFFHKHGIGEKQPGFYVMLAASDTGIGMDKEIQEHIFDPFFTTKEIGKGTGLGLSTIHGIVKQNNGFIWVYSEPGQGSTFKIYLPKAKGFAEFIEKKPSPVKTLGGVETILIAEDDNATRKIMQTVLKRKGYKVLKSENGEDALRVCEGHDGLIDLLITDVVMPNMGGKELADRLQPIYPRMKVIYMSGYADNAIAHHGVLARGVNFIEKPFTPEGLARRVREALNTE